MAVLRMQRARGRSLPNAEPNVIPFIDVLLVLLIIFMVTAPQPTVDLRVDVPRSGHGSAASRATIVSIRQEGDSYALFVDDQPIASSELEGSALAHALGDNPTLTTAEARTGSSSM